MIIIKNCYKKKRSLSTAWIDYRKAFNSVPHSWILKPLDIYKVSPVIKNFLKYSVKLWNTNLFLNHTKGSMKCDKININCGIFQGDSLSPLLLYLSLIPLTNEINNTKYGYEVYEKTIDHLFYMDDLKLYAKNVKKLGGLVMISVWNTGWINMPKQHSERVNLRAQLLLNSIKTQQFVN